jgi:hypothetical protein
MPTITKIKRNDTRPSFTATLVDAAGNAVDLSGAAALFLMRDPRTRALKVSGAMTIVDPAAGTVRYDWAAGDTDKAAVYQVEVQITFGDTTIETFPNGSHHRLEVVKDLGP